MRISRTPLATGVGVLVASALLAGCGGGGSSGGSDADGEVTGSIRFQTWSLTPTYKEYLDGVISDFEAANPGTSVEPRRPAG